MLYFFSYLLNNWKNKKEKEKKREEMKEYGKILQIRDYIYIYSCTLYISSTIAYYSCNDIWQL